MKDFLNDYIVTLSSRRRTKITDLLAAARVNKGDLDALAIKLADVQREAPMVLPSQKFGSRITSSGFDGANADVYQRMLELYTASNLISILLDSNSSILASEIKALENELIAMEKEIANYAFTLSDNGFYDFAFIETFNDETMRETTLNLNLTDRSGINFHSDELAVVNAANGTLSLSASLVKNYSLVGEVLASNCLAMATSHISLTNALNTSVSNGWRVAIAAPRPITSKLAGATVQGAQIELELFLSAAAPCDTIILTPFSDMPVEILAVSIYNDSSQSLPIKVLETPTVLDRPFNINFPLQSVSKFRILINQSVYSRGVLPPRTQEVIYRDFADNVKSERDKVSVYMGKSYNNNNKALRRVFLESQSKKNNVHFFKSILPEIDFEPTFGPMTIDKIIKGFNHNEDVRTYKSKVGNFMRKMIDERLFASNPQALNDRQVVNWQNSFSGNTNSLWRTQTGGISQEFPRVSSGVQQPLNADIMAYATLQQERFLDYQYNLGLRNIQIGSGERVFRGVFISKQIPAPSDSGEVKIKVSDTNYNIIGTSRDSSTVTSIEYSVSNKSEPKVESDWVPIMPVDNSFVDAERLFVNEAGIAILRFPASVDGSLVLYKNGYKVQLDNVIQNRTIDNASIKSLQIPIGTFISSDIFTVNYQPYGAQNVINFEEKGLDQTVLASAFDSSGAGETFMSTYNNQIITLKNEPYVSQTSVDELGSYSSLGFQGTYQPITIVMADGTVALNQTNYKGLTQNSLSLFPETTTAYVQSGKNIIFNKPIDEKFTVYYQYLPSNLRFRVVMRVNAIDYVSPTVTSLQLKTKTRKANSRKSI